MTPKLIKTSLAEFVPATWNNKNESGWSPIGDRVIVKPDKAADMSKGGIAIPQDIADRLTMAAEGGVLVAVGEGAFIWNADKATPFAGRKPVPGDRVCMHRYSGQLHMGADGESYRIMESDQIGAVANG